MITKFVLNTVLNCVGLSCIILPTYVYDASSGGRRVIHNNAK